MGPLNGLKVIELAGIGPGPMAAMLLADLGATVLRVERTEPASLGVPRPQKYDLLLRNRRSVPLDLKDPRAVHLVLDMVDGADVLMEGFRPGVTERLGLGPDVCLERNPRLIYGRITGWGQDGPLAQAVGHDLNYIALAGALHAIGRAGQAPAIPINLVGDFGGGTLYLMMGILAALFERSSSGKGQIVDAAMVDGVASLMTQPHGTFAAGMMSNERGTNVTDSGAPFYDVYQCSDERWISIAAVEKKFYAEALRILRLDALLADQWNREKWPCAKAQIAEVVRGRTRDEWSRAFNGVEACFAPVLTLDEAPAHAHLVERGTYVNIDGVTQPAPAPRFSRTPPVLPKAYQPWDASQREQILGNWLSPTQLELARKAGLVG
ncbi:CaiB/BaiF CoA-transferase family protein [Variovorax sp. J31P207]|uniref:CaiB/BaiF CoA transferase family protein n=1 Tax=Variovorax sp. J31P207 TaxID=3053510 RepID=UPI002575C1BE|nr:CaiB/BaiF CoA-transferase family protein [Variovorax sp. J31P207]MDM0069966.1 CaiB/BaiF CoA-transferase family protein [Variovorax sp. J31P207]